jgi:hypothetical protein
MLNHYLLLLETTLTKTLSINDMTIPQPIRNKTRSTPDAGRGRPRRRSTPAPTLVGAGTGQADCRSPDRNRGKRTAFGAVGRPFYAPNFADSGGASQG